MFQSENPLRIFSAKKDQHDSPNLRWLSQATGVTDHGECSSSFQCLKVGDVGGCWATGMSPVVDFEMSTVGLLAVGKREKICWAVLDVYLLLQLRS